MNFKQAQSKLSSRENTCKEISDYYLNNYKKFNDNYRLVVTLNKTLEKDVALLDYEKKGGHSRSFLHGIPLLVSDFIDLKGETTTAGIKLLENNIAKTSANIVRKLKQNGLLIYGKTNSYELANLTDLEELFYYPRNEENEVCNGLALAIYKDLAPAGLDVCIDGYLLKHASNLNLSALKITPNLINNEGLILPSKSSSLGLVGHDVLDLAFLLNIVKSDKKSEALYGSVHNYVKDILIDPFNYQLGTTDKDLKFYKDIGLKIKSVAPKYKQKEEVINLDEVLCVNSGKTYQRTIYSLDAYLKLNRLDAIIFDKYETAFATLVNPILTITVSDLVYTKTIFIVAHTYNEDKLLAIGEYIKREYPLKIESK